MPIALLAAGCIIDSTQSSTGPNLIVTWSFEALQTQTPAACPPGFDTAAVSSQQVDIDGNPVGDPIVDLFTCADGAGTTSPLTGDMYVETVAIQTDDAGATYGKTLPVTTGANAQEVDTPPIYTDGGHFHTSWLVSVNGGSATDCLDALPDAYGYAVQITATGGAGPLPSPSLVCANGSGYTTGYVDGTYSVMATLVDSSGSAVGSSAPIDGNIATNQTQGNTITELGPFVIPVTLPAS